MNVKLVPKGSDVSSPEHVDKDAAELKALRAELKSLLDAHPMTRQVARHLAAFERALSKHGMQAMAKVPVDVLTPALKQLEALVSNWSKPGLAALRSKMSVALIDRSSDPFFGRRGETHSAFTDSRLLVAEASHSMFMELSEQYDEPPPALPIQESLTPISLEFAPSGSQAKALEHNGRALPP